MTTYTEKRGITTKTEYTEFDAIGWSCLDASTIYRATVTEFSIAKGDYPVYQSGKRRRQRLQAHSLPQLLERIYAGLHRSNLYKRSRRPALTGTTATDARQAREE